MQSDFSKTVCAFSEIYGIVPENEEVFKKALTHSSYTKENEISSLENYERLEFLGDAVLELIITDYLYNKYPEKDEGELTAYRSSLVNAVIIGDVALHLGMNEFLLLSKGESKDVGAELKLKF
jgi:ribonuclease-3